MSELYQSADGRWIVFDGQVKNFFNTQQEAKNMANKITFAEQVQFVATSLAQTTNNSSDLESVYFDRGYNDVGSNPITDDDISGLGITANDISLFITLAQQLYNFVNNQTVVEGDYDSTINKLRTDI